MTSYSKLVRHAGNADLFLAVEMSLLAAAAARPVHLHAEGLRGTGKTTILRAARQVLPRIERVRGCLYNCHPDRPHCPEHRQMDRQVLLAIGTEWVPMPFLEVSHSAKVGTVVGSIDLARLTDPTRPQAALLPGTLPQAHRGVIFIDEINRLAETSPELADVLLDVMGTKPGRVQIEETGVPTVEVPAQVTVWAASNPDEEPGPLEEIRRQLADRFDFAIRMARPAEPEVVEDILSLSESWDSSGIATDDPAEAREDWPLKARQLPLVQASAGLKRVLATLYTQFSLESLRAVEALYLGSRLHALLRGYREATATDLLAVAGMALRHRVDPETLARILRFLADQEAQNRTGASGRGPGRLPLPSESWTGTEGPDRGNPRESRDLFSGLTSRLKQALGGKHRAGGGVGSSFRQTGEPSPQSEIPCFSPPNPARPLLEIAPGRLVTTEHDLI